MSNSIIEKLKMEEAALEAQHFGTPEKITAPPQEAEVDPATTQEEETLDPQQEIQDIIVPQVEETFNESPEPKPKKKYTDWKKRFTNFKASADATIHSLRNEVTDLKSRMGSLLNENHTLKSAATKARGSEDIFSDVFTEEDRDTLGDDGLAAIKKASQAVVEKQVKPLQDQLRKAEEDRVRSYQERAKEGQRTKYNTFLDRLEELIPDYKALNVDPKFLQWMKLPDVFAGVPRSELFVKAEAGGDVARVAEFFAEYKHSNLNISTNPDVDSIEDHITPKGSGVATVTSDTNQNNTQETILESEINEFYADIGRGRYRGKASEVKAIEARIDHAYSKGLVLRGR